MVGPVHGETQPDDGGSAEEADPFADKRGWWDYLQSVQIGGANHLRKTLAIDEDGFRRVAGPSHADARGYFLYEVLDEVQKTGISIGRWVELLEPGQDFTQLLDIDHVGRLVLETIVDEQSLRVRKLVEILIAVINFGETNEDAYYRHFLLLAELEGYISSKQDSKEFYGRHSANVAYGISRTNRAIEQLLANGVDPAKAWYAGPGSTPGRIFSSTRQQLKTALDHCTDAERIVLGFSYGTFSAVSRDIHFSVTGTSLNLSWDDMVAGIGRAGVLGLCILIRCQRLTDKVPEGLNRQLRDIFDANRVPTEHVQHVTQGIVDVGDFVLMGEHLAEVVDVATSKYGYRSYKIVYLAERPIESIGSEWLPAFAVRLLYNRQTLLDESAKRGEREGGIHATAATVLAAASPEEQQEALRESLVATWHAGLRDLFRPPAQRRPVGVERGPLPPKPENPWS